MAQVKVSESIPATPSLRTVNLYIPYNGWLYVYKYTGSDANRNANVCAQALSMVANANLYYYENPGWGQYGWSCVTFISYCINVESLYYTPEIIIILYVSDTSNKK